MLIDMHAHSRGISKCCRIPIETVLTQTLDHGMDGIILTNHYQKSYIGNSPVEDFVKRYIEEFHTAKKHGQKLGCSVFFGIEVTMEQYPRVHMLIYGVEPDFLRRHPLVFDCTQEELYAKVHSEGGLLIQAHPFRNGTTVLNPAYLDGLEINSHPLYGKSYAEELEQIAAKHGLLLTSGGDYHADTHRPTCGMQMPETIKDHAGLRDFLLADSEKELYIQEPNTDTPYLKKW